MDQPEEPNEPTSPGMRRVFDELEAESRPAALGGRAGGPGRGPRRGGRHRTVGTARLPDRQRGDGASRRRCLPRRRRRSYLEFLVLRTVDGSEHLIRYGPAVSVGLAADPPALRRAQPAATRRYQFALALREHARRREPVRVELVDGARCDGTIEAVGSDYLEVAEHDLGEARRRAMVRARQFVGFAAVVAVTLPPGRR
jgi:hypothetical protein